MAPASTRACVVGFGDAGEPDRGRLGGKGASLVKMVRLGLPVPPGFILGTEVGRRYLEDGALPAGILADVEAQLAGLERTLDRRLGDTDAPLLVSVRSGAPVSMPGMMDTILNVGLNDDVVDALARHTRDPGFAWSSYERLLDALATTVRGIPTATVEDRLLAAPGDARTRAGVLLAVIGEHGDPFPEDPRDQLRECIAAVFGSWNSPRAKAYRRFRGIDDTIGTACVVQSMVFGNRHGAAPSGSGVAFSRDPSTGAPEPYGEILFDAQGEDVVSGVRDAAPIGALRRRLPAIADQLDDVLATLERDARDLVEIEFTIELGVLWILQTRIGQRSGHAAVKIAVDLVEAGVITPAQAAERVSDEQLAAASAPRFAEAAADVLATGLASSPGGAVGEVVFDAARAQELADAQRSVVLVRPTTSPADVQGFIASVAVVTGRGGRTSHAAVVARGMGRPAVCGIGEVVVLPGARAARVNGCELAEGTTVAVDGDRGLVALSVPPFAPPHGDVDVARVRAWKEHR